MPTHIDSARDRWIKLFAVLSAGVVGIVALNLIGVSLNSRTNAEGRDAAARTSWEYRALSRVAVEELGPKIDTQQFDGMNTARLTEGLNKLGGDGWELVAIEPSHSYSQKAYTPGKVDGKEDPNTGVRGWSIQYPVTYVFKRAR